MTRKEKIRHILDLSAIKAKLYYCLFSADEQYIMLGFLKKYNVSSLSLAVMDATDENMLNEIMTNYSKRLKQLSPDEMNAVRIYATHEGDWKNREDVERIRERIGIKSTTI